MPSDYTVKAVTFEINGRKISGISNGNDQGELLLCLHGWLDNAASFQPLLPYLTNYHVIAIDWPGHGLSDHRSADAHYHFLDWVYDLIALFRTQQWQAIDIVGHSMGAMVACSFAAAFPEHVRTLTLIDAIGVLTADEATTTTQLRKGLLSRLSRNISIKKYHSSLASAVEARMQVSDLDKANAKIIVQRGIEQTAQGFKWRSDNRLRSTSPYRLSMTQAEQIVADIKTPVQLIYANKGMSMVAKGLKRFGPLFKTLTVHKLIGGHHVHMEQPEQVVTRINAFIHQQEFKEE